MKPSFLSSTLSLTFFICVLSVIIMIFLEVKPDPLLFAVISGVVGGYLTPKGIKNTETLPEQPTQTYGTDTETHN